MGDKSQFIKAKIVDLKKDTRFDEKWLQDRIFEDPSVLGLGNVRVFDREKKQTTGGKIDFVLVDETQKLRYVTEIQLGSTDESHIIRTIEYWDIERKRNPSYEHVAVIAAEHVTGRFLNVISLFNGAIPLIALQVQCFEFANYITVSVARVLDVLMPEDEDFQPIDQKQKPFWDGNEPFQQVRALFAEWIKAVDQRLTINETRQYVGVAKDHRTHNFVYISPRSNGAIMTLRLGNEFDLENFKDDEFVPEYNGKYNNVNLSLTPTIAKKREKTIVELMKAAYANWT